MTNAEQAWLAQEYLAGRTQRAIAAEIGVVAAVVNINIMRFCCEWGKVDVVNGLIYDEARKRVLRAALQNYLATGGEIGFVVKAEGGKVQKPTEHFLECYGKARYEHAWLLRAEGLTLHAIGDRLGVHRERVRQMIIKYGRRVQRAIRKMEAMGHDAAN